jgi:hypothetical protein
MGTTKTLSFSVFPTGNVPLARAPKTATIAI